MTYCTACGLELTAKSATTCPRCGAPTNLESGAPGAGSASNVGGTVSRIQLAKTADVAPLPMPDQLSVQDSLSVSAAEVDPPTQTIPPVPRAPLPLPPSAPPAPSASDTNPVGTPSRMPQGPFVDAGGIHPAGLGDRFLARLVDGVLYVGLFLIAVVVTAVLGALGLPYGFVATLQLILYVGAVALIWTYEILGVGRAGQTVGRMILGVKVIDAHGGGSIGPGRAFVRALVFVAMGIPCYLGYISYFLDQTGQYRAWHDKAADDRVVRTARRSLGEAVRQYRSVITT